MAKQYAVFEEWKADGSKPETALYTHKDELRKKEQDPNYCMFSHKLATPEYYGVQNRTRDKRREDEGKCHMNIAVKISKADSRTASDFGLIALRSFIGAEDYDSLKYTGQKRLPAPTPRPPPIETVPAAQFQRHDAPLQSTASSPGQLQHSQVPQATATASTPTSRLPNPPLQSAKQGSEPLQHRRLPQIVVTAATPPSQLPNHAPQNVVRTPTLQRQTQPEPNLVKTPLPQQRSQHQETTTNAPTPQQRSQPFQMGAAAVRPLQQSQGHPSSTTAPVSQQRSQPFQTEAATATSQQQSQSSQRSSAAGSQEPASTTPQTQQAPPSYWTKKKPADEPSPARRPPVPPPPAYPINEDMQPIPQEIWEIVNQLNKLPRKRNTGLPTRMVLGSSQFRKHFLSDGFLRKESPLRKYKGDQRLLSEAFWMWICPPWSVKEEKIVSGK